METIKNYLNAMFANMPNTEAVKKAKAELLQMMEDKYNELIAEGATENSAVGTVISEFGNLDELAEDLGLVNEINVKEIGEQAAGKRYVSFEEAKEFLAAEAKKGLAVAIGVMLCIMSVDGTMGCELLGIHEVIGISIMFGMIAVAIGLFIYNGVMSEKWKFMKKMQCQIDMSTAEYLTEEKNRYSTTHALRLTIGIVMCVICWLPTVIMSAFKAEPVGAMLLFVMVGIGVFLIVYTCGINSSFDKLLIMSQEGTMMRKHIDDQDVEYINDVAKLVMELYWPVITTFYLCWSFITFEWWRTWIIWPIAGVAHIIVKKLLIKK